MSINSCRRTTAPVRRALALCLVVAGAWTMQPAQAGIIDPIGDILPSFAGTANGDLDVTAASVTLIGDTLRFSGTVNGLIGTTPNALYVWGIDRGAGTARFVGGVPSVGGGVLFDSVLLLRTDGTGQFNDLIDGANSVAISGVTFSGDTIVASLPTSRLVSQGFDLLDYGYNFWPRQGAGNNNQISDFAPDATTFLADVPAPASLPLVVGAIAGLAGLRRRDGAR